MTTLSIPELLERIEYPEGDGQPMSDNTEQWNWMTLIKEGLEALFANEPNVFVAGNLLWYPAEGNNRLRVAPDVLVAFGPAKGPRGSYMQWKESDIAPQVVFEVVSPGNTPTEMSQKIDFYETHGVEEYYIYDPADGTLLGYQSRGGQWTRIATMRGWISPRLKVRFDLEEGELVLQGPDGRRFVSYVELHQQRQQAERRAERERKRAEQQSQRAEQQSQRAEQESQRAEQESRRAERLADKLRAMGIDPESV